MRTSIAGLLALAVSAGALAATAQTQTPKQPASGAACRAGPPAPGGMREYPVRTPVPANAVYLGEGVASVAAGKMQMLPNMPGHRQYKPPLFPNAGWDSPVLSTGQKFYEDYVARYWCAPYLADTPDTAYPGRHERAYAPPPPYEPQIARSKAKAADEALMARRLQLIAEAVMASKPFRNVKGASLEPVLTVEGADTAGGPVRGKIEIKMHVLQQNAGNTERMPDGTIKSTGSGPTLEIAVNPAWTTACYSPLKRDGGEVLCSGGGGSHFARSPRKLFTETLDPTRKQPFGLLAEGFYADGGKPADIRLIYVTIQGTSPESRNLNRGRMHPHDAMGRALGAQHTVDWQALATAAQALQ